MKNAKAVETKQLEKILGKYKDCKKNTIIRHALSKNAINSVCHSQDNEKNTDFKFSIDIKTMTATNQKSSGRCWIFAACNLLREVIANKCNIKEFELSQNFVAFYDKLEKINYCLESIIDLIDCDPDDRTLAYVLQNGIADGGQWDMFVNVVKKYGVCPKNAMEETFQSSNTMQMNSLINAEMRRFAAKAQKLVHSDGMDAVRKLKDEVLENLYKFLCNGFGVPTQLFDFEYVDSDDKYVLECGYTPKSFFEKYVGDTLDEYVSIINSPTEDKPFLKTYTIDYLGNVVEGNLITHLNLPIERLKELVLTQLKNKEVVWFGSDCSKYGDREGGVWDDGSWDYSTPFNLDHKMNKADLLNYHASCMNHAMVITGVSLKNDLPLKWKIENSWGTDRANKGYYLMSDTWFDIYVYQAVVNKRYLNKEELEALKQKQIVLKPWDPMGSLAD